MQKQPQDHIFAKMDTIVSKESVFIKGNTIMDKDNKFFPDDNDSDESESMIGGLGTIGKEPSSIMTKPNKNVFADSDSESRGGSMTMEREEKKYSDTLTPSEEEDAEMVKGDDFTDSDEDDLTIRFSK